MKINKKPTEDYIQELEKAMADWLSAHHAQIKIKFYDKPIEIEGAEGNGPWIPEPHFVDKVIVNTEDGVATELKHIPTINQFPDLNMPSELFHYAFIIQESLYAARKWETPPKTLNDCYFGIWQKRRMAESV